MKNVYTRKDAILILYAASQLDLAMGRHPVFKKQEKGKRANLVYENPNDE